MSYISRPVSPGFELLGEDGTKRSICPKAKCNGFADNFVFEIDHGEQFQGELLGLLSDGTNNPIVEWNTTDARIDLKKMKGVSPRLSEVVVDEHTGKIVAYKIAGLSIQVEMEPVCPSSHCPTEYKGGKNMADEKKKEDIVVVEEKDKKTEVKEEVSETEEKPAKKGSKTPPEPAPKPSDDRDEYIAKLIRENEQAKQRMTEMQTVLDGINAAKRAELIKKVPPEHQEYAKGLEIAALEKVVSILGDVQTKAQTIADSKKIIEGTGKETTDQKPVNEDRPANQRNPLDPDVFFDRSGVLKAAVVKKG